MKATSTLITSVERIPFIFFDDVLEVDESRIPHAFSGWKRIRPVRWGSVGKAKQARSGLGIRHHAFEEDFDIGRRVLARSMKSTCMQPA
jgi:hypothetical protein